MKKNIRSAACLVLAFCLLACSVALGGCAKRSEPEVPGLSGQSIIHEPEFGGVYITLTIDEFNALGFEYGDSVDIAFSNGFTLEDVPYYNGYYTDTGDPLLIAYPGYEYIKAAINNGPDLWEEAGLSENDTASVTLSESGAYYDIQDARDIEYTDVRGDYTSDEEFANFRTVEAGDIPAGVLYRSASPCDNQHCRAPYVDDLISEAGVRFIMDLADNDDKIGGYIDASDFDSPYFLSLYEEGNVIPLAMNMNFDSDTFRNGVVAGLNAIAEHEGPYLVHCTEGKDRTGFVCMLLEALCGADREEIVYDYMMTYRNYYGITPEEDSERYEVIVEHVLDPMIRSMAGDDSIDPQTADLRECAEDFLRSSGMSDAQIEAVREALTQQPQAASIH